MRKLFETMREDVCQCSPCHDCHELPRIVHDMFTSNSRTVHDYCGTVALAFVRGYTCGFLDTAHLYRDRQRRDKLYHRDNMPLKAKQTKWHDLPRQNRGQKSCECQPCINLVICTKREILYIFSSYSFQKHFGLKDFSM